MVAVPQTLRAYQSTAVDSVLRAHADGFRSPLVESATGTGKTTLGSEILRRHFTPDANGRCGRRALVLAHRRELVDQFAARARSFGLDVGIERGKQWSKGEQVVVASVQTMRGPRLAAFPLDEFDLILVDECHHAIADGYQAILSHFAAARVVGLTATADRADGRPLGEVFDAAAFRYGIADAVRDGYLVPARGLRVTVPGMDLSKVRQQRFVTDSEGKTRKLDTPAEGWGTDTGERVEGESRNLHEGDLGRAALAPEAVEGVTGPLVELAEGRRTIVFAVNVAHAKALVESLRVRGATADIVTGTMRVRERERVLGSHRSGAVQYLVNVGVLTEGYDDPLIECVAIARPTQSRVFYAQAAGRGLRLSEGKRECLVIDFVGVSCRFSLIGPEDVLGGALVGPVETVGAKETLAEEPEETEVPEESKPEIHVSTAVTKPPRVRWNGGFRAVLVDLMRVSYDVGYRAGKATGRAVKRGAKSARGWLARLLFG